MVKKLLYILLFLLITNPIFAEENNSAATSAPQQDKQSVFLPMIDNSNAVSVKNSTANKDSYLLPSGKRITSSEAAVLKDYENYFDNYIKTHWSPPPPTKSYHLILFIKLNKDGSLKSVSIIQSSGDINTDNYTVNLVKSLAPYKPLPVVSVSKSIDIAMHFEANVFAAPSFLNDVKASITRNSPSNVLLKNPGTSEQKNILKKYLKQVKEKCSKPQMFLLNAQLARVNTVKIKFDINQNGYVSSAEITESGGNADFDKTFLNHIWQTRFGRIPPELNLTSIPVEIQFTLNRF